MSALSTSFRLGVDTDYLYKMYPEVCSVSLHLYIILVLNEFIFYVCWKQVSCLMI